MIEILLVVTIMLLITSMLTPSLKEARDRAKFTRWFAYNRMWSNDPDCVINFNFQQLVDDKKYYTNGKRLRNSAEGCDFPNYNRETYDGYLKNMNTSATKQNFAYNASGRWGKFKKALEFNGVDTYVDVPGTNALNFNPRDSFTIVCNAKFLKFDLGDGLYSKSFWGTTSDAAAQFDLYCDPTKASRGIGAFEVDLFNQCKGIDEVNVNLRTGWHQVIVQYTPNSDPTQLGDITAYADGVIQPQRPTNNSTASIVEAPTNFIIGAIGTNPKYWGAPIKFPFKGYIDELVLFKRALTEGEMKGFYQMGKE